MKKRVRFEIGKRIKGRFHDLHRHAVAGHVSTVDFGMQYLTKLSGSLGSRSGNFVEVRMSRICGVCESDLSSARTIRTREMMNGTREVFEYVICPSCGCLQLIDIPRNLIDYYSDYYGRTTLDTNGLHFRINKLRFWSTTQYRDSLPGRILKYVIPHSSEEYVKELDKSSSMIDVGCASGELLLLMNSIGFENLCGCDPYIDASVQYKEGVKIEKLTTNQLDEKFDVVMAHHVLEHVPNQVEFALELFSILKDGGTVIIRIPTVSSWAFENFGSDWFQLDAPRHLFLHTRESVVRVLTRVGFSNIRIYDDSHIMQILSSKLYEKDIPFNDHKKWFIRHLPLMLISGQFQKMKRQVERLNSQGRGDQICILASKGSAI